MARVQRHRNTGLTLIEVMVSLLVIMVISIGVLSYMYASARNAREADVRITATRLGQLCLDGWKLTGPVVNGVWTVTAFNPTDNTFDSTLPAAITTSSSGITGLGTELGKYTTTIDGATYFITLSYRDETSGAKKLYLLNACVAWSRNYSSTWDTAPRSVWLSSYSIY